MRLSLILLASLVTTTASAQMTDVLFLGNSYTNVNNLPSLVEGLALSGGHAFYEERNTPGGNTLGAPQGSGSSHSTNSTSLGQINSRAWDVVVLQEQSVIPSVPCSRTGWMFPGAASLDATITANDASTRVMLYQTWGRKNASSWCLCTDCENFANYGAMQDELTEGYQQCAALIGAEVAPVGEAWRLAQLADPALELYAADGSHPSLAGSYLAACVFYREIFGETPVGLSFDAGLDPAIAAFLQTVAASVGNCGAESYCPAAPNSANPAGANLSISGSTSVSASNLSLLVTGVPPSEFGLFFYGPNAATTPFGDGTLCISGGFHRLQPPTAASFFGDNDRVLDYSAPPLDSGAGTVTPGSEWRFQYWYRDPAGAAGFNLSNALRLVFCP